MTDRNLVDGSNQQARPGWSNLPRSDRDNFSVKHAGTATKLSKSRQRERPSSVHSVLANVPIRSGSFLVLPLAPILVENSKNLPSSDVQKKGSAGGTPGWHGWLKRPSGFHWWVAGSSDQMANKRPQIKFVDPLAKARAGFLDGHLVAGWVSLGPLGLFRGHMGATNPLNQHPFVPFCRHRDCIFEQERETNESSNIPGRSLRRPSW